MASKSGVPGTLRRTIFVRDSYTCQACGLKGWEHRWPSGSRTHPTAIDGVYLSIDHIVPRFRGGNSRPHNLRTLCTRCNTRKGTKLLAESAHA